jgi:cytochrome P450
MPMETSMEKKEMALRPDEIDLANHDFFVDEVPHWAFRTLREHDPVHWQPERPPNRGFWAVTRFRDIEEVLRDTRTFSSARGITLEDQDPRRSRHGAR